MLHRTPLAMLLVTAFCTGQQTFLANLEPLPFSGGSPGTIASFQVSGAFAALRINSFLHGAWITDGTVAGTRPMTGLCGNAINQGGGGFVPLGSGRFAGSSVLDGLGREPIVYDATSHSVQLVADIAPGPDDGLQTSVVVFGGEIYFGADDGVQGLQLWRSDGTATGTAPVTNAAFLSISQLQVANGLLYFQGRTQGGYEPFRSDGTTAGTFALQSPGGTPFFYEEMNVAPFAGGALLTILDAACYTDGTTVTILGAAGGSQPREYTDLGNGTALFLADGSGSLPLLLSTDGTAAGTSPVPIPAQPGADLYNLTRLGNAAVFAFAPNGADRRLWTSDGTASGTQQISSIELNAQPSASLFERVGNELWFSGRTLATGEELFATDGTAAGTRLLLDYFEGSPHSRPRAITAFGGGVLMTASNEGHEAILWTDGTAAGTRVLASLNPRSGDSLPAQFTRAGSQVVFRAAQLSAGVGPELYVTDGTAAGTGLLLDLTPSFPFGGSSPNQMVSLGARAVFSANTGGAQLYTTDGSAAGTTSLAVPSPEGITGFGWQAIFSADHNGGREPWITDGTAAGTTVLADLNVGGSSNPGGFTRFGNQVLFAAFDTTSGREPWITDGTAAGTFQLADASLGTTSSFPQRFAADDLRGWFMAEDDAGRELWTTDGTTAGTMRVVDLNPGPGSSFPDQLVATDGRVWFSASDGIVRSLWTSDGTAAGTTLLMTRADGADFELLDAAPIGDDVCFLADDGSGHGVCLFVSDGTIAGTHCLLDLGEGGYGGFDNESLTAVPGASLVAFVADDLETGLQVWVSNGTQTGTMVLSSIGTPGVGAFQIDEIAADGTAFYARVNERINGSEPWRFEASATPLAFDVAYGDACGSAAPSIGATGLPVLGDPGYGITLDGVDVSTTGFLFYSSQLTELALVGCELLIAPPLQLYAAAAIAPGMTATAPLPLPNDPAIAGANLFWQWAVLHPNPATLGLFQLTGGLQTHFGH